MSSSTPTDWKEKTIGQLLGAGSLFCDGDWVESKDQDTEGCTRLIQLADIGDGRFLDKSNRFMNDSQFSRLRCTPLVEGDILIARMPDPIGRACLFPRRSERCVTVVDVAILRNAEADPSWLVAAINSSAFRRKIEAASSGTTRTRISRGFLAGLTLLIPPPTVQKKISCIISSLDDAIEKTESLIAKYQQIKAGLMNDLFTRGVTADGKLRPPREQAPELYRETPIGWIPKVWDMSVLDQLCNIIDPQPDHRTPPEQYDGIPYIGIGDFDAFGDLDATSCRRIVVSTYLRQVQRFSVEAGDVIYGKIGTIGQPKKLPNGVYALSANILLMKPVINREFFLHALNTRCFEKQISDVTNTTSQPALGIEKVRKLQLPNPALSEQKIIAQYLDQVDLKLAKEFSVAQKLKKEKAGLMHDLLTGQVRVNAKLSTLEDIA